MDGKTFDEARDVCKKLGGDLVSIGSANEGDNVLYEVRRYGGFKFLNMVITCFLVLHISKSFKMVFMLW